MRSGILLVVAAVLGGCATHHELLAPRPDFRRLGVEHVGPLEKGLTDGQIATWLGADVRAKLPTPVALARLESSCSGYQPYLATIGAEELEGWQKAFESHSLITGVHPVSHLALCPKGLTIHGLRQAAARMGCELLLVYLQSDSTVDNFNEAAALYWTFVGLWLVPGNVVEQKTVAQALLVDCRTGAILGTATGGCHLKRICPAALKQIQKDKLAQRTPRKALTNLQTDCKRLLKNVVDAAVAASTASG